MKEALVYCSFCHRDQHAVQQMVKATDSEAAICNECIVLSVEALSDSGEGQRLRANDLEKKLKRKKK